MDQVDCLCVVRVSALEESNAEIIVIRVADNKLGYTFIMDLLDRGMQYPLHVKRFPGVSTKQLCK